MSIYLKIKKLAHSKNLNLPAYATEHSAGMDLLAAIDEPVILKPGQFKIIPSGIIISQEIGMEAQIRPRSGLAAKYGVTVLNTPGTIDADYRGEIKVILINHGPEDFVVERGMRIAQMIIAKHEHIIWQEEEALSETVRGAGGLGSTGYN